MLTSSQYRTKTNFILELAMLCFGDKLMEAIRPEEIYYVRDTQVISMSQHALIDGQEKGRLWWNDENHLKDSNFTNFANKVLDKLKIFDSLPDESNYNISRPQRKLDTKIGVCDAKEMKGWVIALQYSKDEAQSLDSCHVVTILNKNSGTMNMNVDLFAKKDVYIVNVDTVDKQMAKSKVISPEESVKKELADINAKLAKLEDEHDIAYIEYDDEQDPKLKLRKKKDYESLVRQIEQLKNRKAKLDKPVSEMYTVINRLTDESIQILMV